MISGIPPKLKIRETISNPIDQAEVFGFTGRDQMLGQPAIVMKEAAIEGDDRETVSVPTYHADLLADEDSLLVVLRQHVVLVIDGTDFAAESVTVPMEGGGETAEVKEIAIEYEGFNEFTRSQVDVTN